MILFETNLALNKYPDNMDINTRIKLLTNEVKHHQKKSYRETFYRNYSPEEKVEMLENFDSKHSTEYILPLFKTIPCGNTDYYREGTFKFPSERVPSCYYSRQQITGNSIPIELVPEIFKGSLLSKYKLINEIKIINNQYESDEETDALILELLTSVNKYNIIHKEISELFNKVCKLGNELIKTCYIRYYTTTNVIPQPYYQLLRSMVKEKGKDLGDYSFYESFIIYMMGSIIGFVIVF